MTVDALPSSPGEFDAVSLIDFRRRASVLRQDGGREELLLRPGRGSLRLSIRSGSCLRGPVRFRYVLEGLRTLPVKLLTLRRLLSIARGDRPSRGLYPREPRAERWVMMLRALDGLAAGASHRDIATVLYGESQAEREWRAGSDYLRLRVQRLARIGLELAAGGYRELLAAPATRRERGDV